MGFKPRAGWDALFARFERDAGALAAEDLTARLYEVIDAAPDARRLWRVLDVEGIDYCAMTWDTELRRADVDRVVRRVLTWTRAGERARGLGILGALVSLDVRALVAPAADRVDVKRGTIASIDAIIGALRRIVEVGTAAERAGAALLLARLRTTTGQDVDQLARLASAAMPPDWQLRWPLGFHDIEQEVPGFLAAVESRWSPLAVRDRGGRRRRWHPAKLWREYVLAGSVALADAADALLALPPEELLDRVLSRRDRIVLSNLKPPPAAWQRDRELLHAVVDALAARGHDVRAAIVARVAVHKPLGENDGNALGACLAHVTRPGDGERDGETARRLLASAVHQYGE